MRTSPLSFFSDLYHSALSFVTTYTVDVVVIGVLFSLLLWYTIRYGKGRITSLILSLYISLLAFTHFPYPQWFHIFGTEGRQVLFAEASIFLVLTGVIAFILGRVISGEFSFFFGFVRTLEAILLAGSATLLLLAFWYQVLPLSEVYAFGAPIQTLFAAREFFFWWLLIPLGTVLLTSRT